MTSPSVASSTTGPRSRGRRPVTAPFLAAVLMALLSFEFLLGTYLNLFVPIPTGGNVSALPLDGLVVLILHIVVGILVIGTAGRLAYVAWKSHDRLQTALAVIAVLGMVFAFLAGADFTFVDQAPSDSFGMAFFFFLGMICSALIVARAHLPRPADEPKPA